MMFALHVSFQQISLKKKKIVLTESRRRPRKYGTSTLANFMFQIKKIFMWRINSFSTVELRGMACLTLIDFPKSKLNL